MAGGETARGAAVGPLTTVETGKIRQCVARLDELRQELAHRIVGQETVIEELLMAILGEGHCLVIGVPGLAKTLLISTIAELLGLDFKRIQFTPDLMPNDIIGATIISGATTDDTDTNTATASGSSCQERGLRFRRGPVFTNLLLADEINRTPPKTQAALMEAMEERQITAHAQRYPLDSPFFVLATQNPIEQEGTYPLPVSQLDRFLFTVHIDYPTSDEEFRVMELTTSAYHGEVRQILDRDSLLEMVGLARRIEVSDRLVGYTTRIVRASRPSHTGLAGASRQPESPAPAQGDGNGFGFVGEWISWGGGPRAIQSIITGARSRALLHGRPEVTVDDIHRVVFPALRHRILLNYHGIAEGVSPDRIIERILTAMPERLYTPPRPKVKPRRRRSLLLRLLSFVERR